MATARKPLELVDTGALMAKREVLGIDRDPSMPVRLPTYEEVALNRETPKNIGPGSIWVTAHAGGEPFVIDIDSKGELYLGADAELVPGLLAKLVGVRR